MHADKRRCLINKSVFIRGSLYFQLTGNSAKPILCGWIFLILMDSVVFKRCQKRLIHPSRLGVSLI